MFLVQIKNKQTQQITHQAPFETMELAQIWLNQCESVESFGKPEHLVYPDRFLSGFESVEPIIVPAEYEIIIEDISTKVKQEKINAEALAYLQATDYMVLRAMENPAKPVPQEIVEARQAARDRIVR